MTSCHFIGISVRKALSTAGICDMGYGLNLGWGGPIVDYLGFWVGPIKGYTTNLVQGSYGYMDFWESQALDNGMDASSS